MLKFLEEAASKLGLRRESSSVATGLDGWEIAVDAASQSRERKSGNEDMTLLDSISASKYLSEARKDTSNVEWKLKDFLHLNKVYMLNPGPSIIVEAGNAIDLPINFKFSLENIYSTCETRSHIWLLTEIVAAPPGVENVVCKFTTQVLTDGVKVKELSGSPVTIPTRHKNPRSNQSFDKDTFKFKVACLIPWDSIYSSQKLLTIRIQISIFSRRTLGTTEVTNIKETMDKSGNAFSVQIGSLLRNVDSGGEIMFSDVKLILKDNVTVAAHRAILASRSPVFKAMLLADMEESKSGIINIPDVESKAMDVLLHHIYTGKVDPSCNQIIEQVIYAAAKYHLPELLEYCDKIVITICDNENAIFLLKLAKMHDLKNAIRDVTNYVRMNSTNILETILDE